MKICIHQYAFIATIICATTALYPMQTQPVSESTIRLLMDKASMIESELRDLLDNYQSVTKQQQLSHQYSYKDKTRTPKQRSTIRKLQDGTKAALDDLHSKIITIKNHLETTLQHLDTAILASKKRIHTHMTDFSEISDQ